jgi:hypothetical protein
MRILPQIMTPNNLSQIVKKEGYWEDYSFEPVLLSVEELNHNGHAKIVYQLLIQRLKNYEELKGKDWEMIVLKYAQEVNPKLANQIHSKSNEEECILWVENEQLYRQLLTVFSELVNSPDDVTGIYEQIFE